MGAKTVVITCGGDGAVLASPTHNLQSGVYPVTPIDATGTGDAFLSGFVYGLLENASPQKCLEYGTAMGASCVRSMGATTGVFSAPELNAYVKQSPLTVRSC
jgi:sugar/nucleoside kinase (ribokinase family)